MLEDRCRTIKINICIKAKYIPESKIINILLFYTSNMGAIKILYSKSRLVMLRIEIPFSKCYIIKFYEQFRFFF